MMLQHTLTNADKVERRIFNGRGAEARANSSGSSGKEQDERLAALHDLLASPHFKASERNKRFLEFVIQETIAGRADRIKAFTIAVDVFGRDADFDATVDPIVRIAAGQLRKSLGNYYADHGRLDAIKIGLPLGGYVPSFTKCSRTDQFGLRLGRILGARALVGAGLSVLAAVIVGYGASRLLPASSLEASARSGNAVIILDSARVSAEDRSGAQFAHALTEALWVQMGRHDGIRLVGVRVEEKLDSVVSQAREAFSDSQHMYQLLTTVQTDAENVRVYWHLVDVASRETYYSSQVSQEVASETRNAAADMIAASMASSLFGYDGVLSQYAEGARILANDSTR